MNVPWANGTVAAEIDVSGTMTSFLIGAGGNATNSS